LKNKNCQSERKVEKDQQIDQLNSTKSADYTGGGPSGQNQKHKKCHFSCQWLDFI
jgi:hypothetical protein